MTTPLPALDTVRAYLTGLQDRICAAMEQADGRARFVEDGWTKDPASPSPIRGGGALENLDRYARGYLRWMREQASRSVSVSVA